MTEDRLTESFTAIHPDVMIVAWGDNVIIGADQFTCSGGVGFDGIYDCKINGHPVSAETYRDEFAKASTLVR